MTPFLGGQLWPHLTLTHAEETDKSAQTHRCGTLSESALGLRSASKSLPETVPC
jgi:hypothetical protein